VCGRALRPRPAPLSRTSKRTSKPEGQARTNEMEGGKAMIYKQKGSRYYFAKFRWMGQLIHRSTRARDAKTARSIEGKLRVELAKGNWGILEKKPAPTLAEFLKREFQPFTETRFATKPKSLDYYLFGANMLTKSDLRGLRLD